MRGHRIRSEAFKRWGLSSNHFISLHHINSWGALNRLWEALGELEGGLLSLKKFLGARRRLTRGACFTILRVRLWHAIKATLSQDQVLRDQNGVVFLESDCKA